MSAELETMLGDLIMRAERTTAEFRAEVGNARRIEEAVIRLRQLNEAAYNEAMALLQLQAPTRPPQMMPVLDVHGITTPHLPAWN